MDGDGPTVVKAYEDSIRQQEEHRLRLKKRRKLQELAANLSRGDQVEHLLLEISSSDGRPQAGRVYLSDIALLVDGERVASWPMDADAFNPERGTHLEREGSSWGDIVPWQGRVSRPMLNYGSPFHKVAGVFAVPAQLLDSTDGTLACSIDYASPEPCDVTIRLFVRGRELLLGRIAEASGEWKTYVGEVSENGGAAAPRNIAGVHGTGAVVVTGARFVSDDGREVHVLEHGAPGRIEIDYAILQPELRERCQVVVAIHKDGIDDVCRYITRDLVFDSAQRMRGVILLTIPRLTWTSGTYAVTVMIAKEGYYDTEQLVFYSINPSVYSCVSRLFEVSVVGSGLIGSGTRHVLDGNWSLQ
jgi:hypothetical protein